MTRAQLLELGLGARAIDYRVKIGRLFRVFAGVYAIGLFPLDSMQGAAAAVIACGRGAMLSHGSAATLWGMLRYWSRPLEVIAGADLSRQDIRVHRTATLRPRDTTTHFGIAVTSPARTIFDMAPRFGDLALERIISEARIARHLNVDDLQELLARFPRSRSTERLRRFSHPAQGPTRSEFERRFLAFAAHYNLPRPLVGRRVAGHEVDFLFPGYGLIVELDGFEFHGARSSFERDRDRDADTLAAGHQTVRLTWQRFTRAPAKEAARLRSIMRKARPRDAA